MSFILFESCCNNLRSKAARPQLEIRGDGSFSLPAKWASGAEIYVRKYAVGNELDRGPWSAVDLVGLVAYDAGSASRFTAIPRCEGSRH